jgi:DinB superfamily
VTEEFYRRDLTGARVEEVDLSDSWWRNVYLRNVVMRGLWLENVDIDAGIQNVTINGVDIGPLIEAELDRRDPDRLLVRAETADGFRAGWEMTERRWAATIERARGVPEELLHERVRDEWSFIETLRHLVFATDAWVLRAYLGDPWPYDPLGLPFTEMEDIPGIPNDPDARPSLDEILAVRESRFAVVREVLAGLTDERLAGTTQPVEGPGYPAPERYPVTRVLGAILTEEWLHREYAERDLAVLVANV